MKIRPFRIPKTIVLPGIVVQVKEIPRTDPELGGDGGGWTYNVPGGAGPSATIFLDETLSVRRKRYTLMHELQHLMVDYLHICLKYYPELVEIC